ncbi:MAG: NAD(P)-dependent oxidoreductase [Armatimonadia bacterium]
MTILLTGAAGVLGQTITALLESLGHTLRLTDLAPLQTPHEFVAADLSDPAQTTGLCESIDQVLHVAAIHPWKPYTPQQYLDLNIKGTHNIVAEAARAGVQRLIYTSSVGAMGYDVAPDSPLPFDESRPCRPYDSLYSLSKHAGEQLCRLYAQTAGLRWLALRPGTFIPRLESDPAYGLALLGIAVHRDDVAQAHVRALQSALYNDFFIIAAGNRFTKEDAADLATNAPAAILRRYPEAAELTERGVPLPERLAPCYDIGKARNLLGYEPQITFDSWLQNWLRQSERRE